MLQKSLLMLLLCMSLSVQASRLARIAAKVNRPLQKALAVLACSAATCFVGIKAEAGISWLDSDYGARLKELSLGSGSHPSHGFVAGKAILADNGNSNAYEPSVGYLHGITTLNGDEARLQQFNAYLYYNYLLPDGRTYGQANKQIMALTVAGLDHYDMRGFELSTRSPRLWFADHHATRRAESEEDTDGFVVSHLHWMGIESPFFSSKVGVGDLGLVKTGLFRQADLEAWAGDGADFSYLFFLTNSIGVNINPMENGVDAGPLNLGFKIEQMRTLSGDIDFADGTDGSFTALWESAQAEFEITLFSDRYAYNVVKLGADLAVFRQRIDAESEAGKHFSQHKNGGQFSIAIRKYWD